MADVRGVLTRAVISTGGMVAQGLARFLYTLAVGNMVGVESLGEVSTLLSISVYTSLVWPAAAGVAASRFFPVTTSRAEALTVLRRSFFIAVVALTAIAGLGIWFTSGNIGLTASCALLVASYAGYVFTRGALLGDDKILRATVLDSVTSAFSIAALMLVLFAGAPWALLLPIVGSYALFTVLAWPRGKSVRVSQEQRSTVLSYTRATLLTLLATGGLLPAAQILVRASETPLVTGLFAAGLSLATPASLVSQAVNQVLIPQFAAMNTGKSSDVVRLHRKLFLLTLAGFTVIFGALIALAPWLLALLYNEEFADAALAMQLLLVGVYLMSIIAAPSAYLMALGHQRVSAKVWLVSFLVGTITMLSLAPSLGQWGVLTGYLLGTTIGTMTICVLAFTRKPVTEPEVAPPAEGQSQPTIS